MRILFLFALLGCTVHASLFSGFFDENYDPEVAEQIGASLPTLDERVPIMLIPPLSGSSFSAKLTHAKEPHIYCRHNGMEGLWLVPRVALIPGYLACLVHNFELIYDPATDTTTSPPGVEVVVDPSLSSLITNSTTSPGAYGAIATVLKGLGYVENQDLRGFPFDWRLGPHMFTLPGGAFDGLKAALEKSYVENGNRSSILIAMSMSSPWVVLFLERHVDQAWKDKYIHSLLSLSGLFAGSLVSMQYQISPSLAWQHSVPPKDAVGMMHLLQTLGSVSWFAPHSSYFNDTVVVSTTDGVEYTANEIDKLLEDAGANVSAAMWRAAGAYSPITAPGVNVTLFYGVNVSTPCAFIYPPHDWLSEPTTLLCDGDGFAPLASMEGPPLSWSTQQMHAVETRRFPGVVHAATLFDPLVLLAIGEYVSKAGEKL